MITGLWGGQPFSFQGIHYRIRDVQFLPAPVQQPRIRIWVAAGWPRKRPVQRAAKQDEVFRFMYGGLLEPVDYRELLADIQQYRPRGV